MSRSISIYGNKEFSSPWSELLFAKDYNKKINNNMYSTSSGFNIYETHTMSSPRSPDSRLRYN